MMEKFCVYLRSRGDQPGQGMIRIHYTIVATDEVEAAMRAKEKAKKRFKNRATAPWYADLVEKLDVVAA